ncbi:PAS domain-containing protein [Sphingomonas sp. RP10(2022)]|uniref:PAS domain-containing protein n=1 Tax=Sphingomonas liriopis TaxID=2949094 RepID=A0A9X2HWV1_9SPHN|nr:PAS domain-containing protein [Sphingomonas liriopis]MCP3735033.1 PAS domain-containing protein [Sphingomonas liriopis]
MPIAGPTAHGLIGRDGRIADIDAAYAALLGMPRDAARGRPVADVTHPADRAALAAFLTGAWDSGDMKAATIRHRDAQGRAIWVNLHVSRLGAGDCTRLVVTCRPLPQGEEPSTVKAHWQMARLLIQALDGGKRAFGDSLIGNPATEILLRTYVAEAEARALTAGQIALGIDVAWPLTRRWLLALVTAGFVESEIDGPIQPATPIRLSPRALAMIEAIFGALVTIVQDTRVIA